MVRQPKRHERTETALTLIAKVDDVVNRTLSGRDSTKEELHHNLIQSIMGPMSTAVMEGDTAGKPV